MSNAVEKTAFVCGGPLTATIERLHRALNHLAGECSDGGQPLPSLIAATSTSDTATLHLAGDAELPAPWTGTGTGSEWTLCLDKPLADRQDVLSPYPMLVTIGSNDARRHLVNLEHLAVVTLTGDPDRATALARHIAAELALNPWSTLVEVTMIGFGEELAQLDDLRLHHHNNGDQVVPSLVRDVTESIEIGWGDPGSLPPHPHHR